MGGGSPRCVCHTHTFDWSSPSTERCERRAARASDSKAPRWWIVHHSISRDIPGAVSRPTLALVYELTGERAHRRDLLRMISSQRGR